ncbi:glycosyltransferase [Agromyces atrinae]|uniref:glycosyltransferase n=1 Tax=Agromyces atrinae TaxID=592376 RepID=UPI001F58CF75|nr:glycosyltransferase [Agromyces atrinae]MCI2958000.1 glycosyltransferase [Agromyces atrinae]
MSRLLSAPRRLVDGLLRDRTRLPRFVNRTIDHIADHPDGLLGRLAARSLGGFDASDIPAPTAAPATAARVYIGPTNYAAQGRLWAAALDASDADVGARNMAVDVPGGFDFPADTIVPVPVYTRSREWQEAELEAVGRFSHVLIEAERALFGRLFSRDVERETAELERRGLSVAFLCHGTDIRLPSRHVGLTPWSPYADADSYNTKFERDAARNRALLDRLDRPTFVSTPDLLLDVPYATWCPVVVDGAVWQVDAEPENARPLVVHVPSKSAVKGTALIERPVRGLEAEGLLDYRTVSGVAARQMPGLYRSADIVLDQFRLGSYGVAAVEAMAAGRVVVGHVLESVRRSVSEATGFAVPIVEATPDTVGDVLRELAADPEHRARLGREGVAFAEAVHDGRLSARVLLDGWIES